MRPEFCGYPTSDRQRAHFCEARRANGIVPIAGSHLAWLESMRKVVLTVVTGLLIVGYTGASRAQDVVLHTVTFTASLDCTPGVESGVQIYVDARGPSPGDIIIAGSIQGCQPELGPFLDSSTICRSPSLA